MPRLRYRIGLAVAVAALWHGTGSAQTATQAGHSEEAARTAGSAPALAVCIDTASAAAARDQAVAAQAAAHSHLSLAVHHFDGNTGDDDGIGAGEFRAMLASQCDLVLGYPIDLTDGQPPQGMRVTAPYDQTGYVLVTDDTLDSSGLADLPQGTAVAVTYGTVPNLYFIPHHNVQSDIRLTEADTLKALVSGQVKAAMLWQPTIAQYLAAHPDAKLTYHPLAEPHARFNIVALYIAKGAAAAAQFQAALPPPNHPAAVKAGSLNMNLAPDRRLHAADRFGWMPPARYVHLAAAETAVSGSNAASGSVPALYTAAQAQSGAAKYSDNCAQCHGPTLEGQSGPALKGPLFASVKTGFSVGDILTFMAINMPATQPGSLSHDDYTDIMAYVLSQNGFPAGSAALTFDGGEALKVPLLYHGK